MVARQLSHGPARQACLGRNWDALVDFSGFSATALTRQAVKTRFQPVSTIPSNLQFVPTPRDGLVGSPQIHHTDPLTFISFGLSQRTRRAIDHRRTHCIAKLVMLLALTASSAAFAAAPSKHAAQFESMMAAATLPATASEAGEILTLTLTLTLAPCPRRPVRRARI